MLDLDDVEKIFTRVRLVKTLFGVTFEDLEGTRWGVAAWGSSRDEAVERFRYAVSMAGGSGYGEAIVTLPLNKINLLKERGAKGVSILFLDGVSIVEDFPLALLELVEED